jgi:hypothetical protein
MPVAGNAHCVNPHACSVPEVVAGGFFPSPWRHLRTEYVFKAADDFLEPLPVQAHPGVGIGDGKPVGKPRRHCGGQRGEESHIQEPVGIRISAKPGNG